MKRILSLLLVLCIVLLSFAACGNKGGDETPDDGASTQTPDDGGSTPPADEKKEPTSEEKYNAALALIAEGKYTEAYNALKALGDYKDAKTQLSYFLFLPETLSYVYEDSGTDCEYEYDANGRLSKVVCTEVGGEAAVTVTFTYDANGNLTEFSRDFSEGSDEDTTRTWEYDEDGNCIREVSMESGDGTRIYVYTYNEDGQLIKSEETSTYPGYISEMTYTYTYDENGNLTSTVCVRSDNNGPEYTERQDVTYDENGNQQIGEATYDDNGNVLTYEFTYTNGSKDYFYYTYDENGNLLVERNVSEYGENTITYTYDANGNLIKQVNEGEYSTVETTYTYDENGNLIKQVHDYGDGYGETTDYTYVLVYAPNEMPEFVQAVLDDWQALFYDID